MSSIQFDECVVWITGASSGIGRSVALELADRGAQIALSARREKKLKELAEECESDASVYPLDVTDREKNQHVAASIVEDFGRIDIAFFNAGVFGTLSGEAFDADEFEWNMSVNYLGTVYGIEASLPHLKESDVGYVVGMSSGAAYGPLPRGSAYGSSKTAVKYMMNSLDFEWSVKDVDVDVSVVCPGVVRTPMTEEDDFPYEPPPSLFEVSPKWASAYIVNRMKRKKHEIALPIFFTMMLRFLGILPNPIHQWILKMMNKNMVRPGH